MRKYISNTYISVESEENFILELNMPVYKEIKAGKGFVIRNKQNGEVVGNVARLKARLHNMKTFARLQNPVLEEDIYEIVEEGEVL
jgi:hypothetical protein